MDAWRYYLAAIQAAFPSPPPEDVQRYLETFDADSDANRAARRAVFNQMPSELQRQLTEILRQTEPQLFN